MPNSVFPRGQSLGEVVRKASHDLHGPVINIHCFSDELRAAAQQLMSLVDRERSHLPPAFCAQVAQLLDGDITPCVDSLGLAADQLDQRMEELTRTLDPVLHRDAHRSAL